MRTILALAALLAAAPAAAQQSARKQPEPGLIPGPSSSRASSPDSVWNPNSAQGLGQPGFGASLPAGTEPGSSNAAAANSQAQPTNHEGKLYRTNLNDNNVYPYRLTNPDIGGNVIGPQAPHKLPRPLIEPLPPDYTTPTPPPRGGTNIQRGAPQGSNPATNASPSGLSPEKELPATGQPGRVNQMLSPSPVIQPTP